VPQFHPEIEVEELEPYHAFYRTQPDPKNPKNGSSLRSPPLPGIRRIYFSDRLYSEEELPPEFKLFLPVGGGSADPARHAMHRFGSCSLAIPTKIGSGGWRMVSNTLW